MNLPPTIRDLPVSAVLGDLSSTLASAHKLVLQAPPGAGKTTVVPLALLQAPWLKDKRLIMLEPRRLAARAAAHRMAALLGEEAGETVGYRMRLDTKVGPRTRIEIVTEGVFTRLLDDDPGLHRVGAVIFDEFHERSLSADLGLALALDIQGALRPDLRLLVMSATIAAESIAGLLGDAAIIRTEGRQFPVATHYTERRVSGGIAQKVAAATVKALKSDSGSVLVFLPGAGEIRRVHDILKSARLPSNVRMLPLYGKLPKHAQEAAILPAQPGTRKVVLATDIAETSITIEGVRIVIDSGLRRVPRFDPRTGMTRLETARTSRASADQRRGRAGRTEPGICYRLWTEAEHAALPAFDEPEIQNADLAALALDLADWGVQDPSELRWLDPPPAGALLQARELLRQLGALDTDHRITEHGRRIQGFGVHPRLAHMMVRGHDLNNPRLAAQLAALLGERDILHSNTGSGDPDLRLRLEALSNSKRKTVGGMTVNTHACRRVRDMARRLERHLPGPPSGAASAEAAGLLLAFAYPDRIAQKRGAARNHVLMSNGRGAWIPETSLLMNADYIVVADVDDTGKNARIWLAAPLSIDDLMAHFSDHISNVERVEWDSSAQGVVAHREWRLGQLVLRWKPLSNPDPEALTAALLKGIREAGVECLPWRRETRQIQARILFLRNTFGDDWPDVSDAGLKSTLETWLAPFVNGMTRLADLARLDLNACLYAQLDWNQTRRLEELAPTHMDVPSGSRIRLDYCSGEIPVLPVRIQEMFGARKTPRVANGHVPVLLHLLSPAGRPAQITQDLENFWNDTYDRVRKDLKGRYPRHYWPDDPWQATPTRRVKPKK